MMIHAREDKQVHCNDGEREKNRRKAQLRSLRPQMEEASGQEAPTSDRD